MEAGSSCPVISQSDVGVVPTSSSFIADILISGAVVLLVYFNLDHMNVKRDSCDQWCRLIGLRDSNIRMIGENWVGWYEG